MRSIFSRRQICAALICMLIGWWASGALADGGTDDHHRGALRQALPASSAAPAAAPVGGTGYLMLAATDFKTDSDADKFFRYYTGNTIEPTSGTSGIGISAPVHLPQGAQITKVTAFYYDSDPASAPLIDLYRGITGTLEIVGNLSAAMPGDSFASGETSSSVDVIGGATVVDNSRYSYMIIGTLNRSDTTPSQVQRLHSVRVDYTFATHLPAVIK
jgi:hypothetical protein